VSEFEKNRIKERTLEGIAKAKAQGKFLGRAFGLL
jgi:DNA invertase Pin-like site-specific DNA recombinase